MDPNNIGDEYCVDCGEYGHTQCRYIGGQLMPEDNIVNMADGLINRAKLLTDVTTRINAIIHQERNERIDKIEAYEKIVIEIDDMRLHFIKLFESEGD